MSVLLAGAVGCFKHHVRLDTQTRAQPNSFMIDAPRMKENRELLGHNFCQHISRLVRLTRYIQQWQQILSLIMLLTVASGIVGNMSRQVDLAAKLRARHFLSC